jgi:uncharacterized protein YdhG (YjbR/CyaY superfamily)
MQSKAKTVDDYLSALPPDRHAELKPLRKLIRRTLPQAEETMAYGMPTYMGEKMICAFAAQKNYLALYLCGLGANRKEFARLNCGKGCVRFKKLEELPLEAVTKVLLAAAAP